MANAAAQVFASFLDSKDLKYEIVKEDESMTVLKTGVGLENTQRVLVVFYFDNSCDNVAVRAGSFIDPIPSAKVSKALEAINKINREYRWLKFTMDTDDNTITAAIDAVIQLDSCAEECYELFMRTANIVDSAYPEMMAALWG